MVYFYARVSTKEQNLDRQLDAAKKFKNIDTIFCDKQSGKDFERNEYQKMKRIVKSGDEIIIKELDRLGRDKNGIKNEIRWYSEKGIILRILDIPTTLIDFQGQEWIAEMVNNILIEVMGAIAQNEREKNRQRQREGIEAMAIIDGKRISSKTGRSYGRQKIELGEVFEILLEQREKGLVTVKECCDQLGISQSTWYSRVSKFKKSENPARFKSRS